MLQYAESSVLSTSKNISYSEERVPEPVFTRISGKSYQVVSADPDGLLIKNLDFEEGEWLLTDILLPESAPFSALIEIKYTDSENCSYCRIKSVKKEGITNLLEHFH